MHPWFLPAQEELRARAGEFARTGTAPVAAALGAESRFLRENVRRLADMGPFRIDVPQQYGGPGLDRTSHFLVIEQLARANAGRAIATSIRGGGRIFTTGAGVAEIFVGTAGADRSQGVWGIGSFIVSRERTDRAAADRAGVGRAAAPEPFAPGVRAGRKEDRMRWRASRPRELYLDAAIVPAANRPGKKRRGFREFTPNLNAGRSGTRAMSLGLAQGTHHQPLLVLDGSDRPSREAGQGTQSTRAEPATAIAAARHLVHHAAWLRPNGQPFTSLVAMARQCAGELTLRVTARAVSPLGTRSRSSEYPLQRLFCNVDSRAIGGGTSEVQKTSSTRNLSRDPDRAAPAGPASQ